jgi:hypothetical protein
MTTVHVVVVDRACEFGPPVAVFSTKELANSYVDKERKEQMEMEGFYFRGYLIYPFNIDDESGVAGKATLVKRDGNVVLF